MIFEEKVFIYSLALFSILSSCKKEVELDQLTVSTFELYSPEQHEMNQNGLFFIDRTFDINQKSLITLFGFDKNANNKFKIRLGIESFIQNSQNYDTIRVNKLLVDEKVLLLGDAVKGDSLVVFINEIDQFNGDLIYYHEFVFDLPVDSIQFLEFDSIIYGRDLNFMTDLLKSSNGYELLLFGRFGYDQKIIRNKVDLDFNIIEVQDQLLYSDIPLDSIPLPTWLFYSVYNDAILTDDDELIIGYYKLQTASYQNLYPSPFNEHTFMIQCFNNNSIKWSNNIIAGYKFQNSLDRSRWFDKLANRNIKVKKIDNELLVFSKTFLNLDPWLSFDSLLPSVYFFDINNGLYNSHRLIDHNELSVPNDYIIDDVNVSVFNDNIIFCGNVGTDQSTFSFAIHFKKSLNVTPMVFENSFNFAPSTHSKFNYVGLNETNTGNMHVPGVYSNYYFSRYFYIANGFTSFLNSSSSNDPSTSFTPLSGFVTIYDERGNI
mgnify:CR=1 FL=1